MKHEHGLLLKGPDGTEVIIDLRALKLSNNERAAVDKVVASGDTKSLTDEERKLISTKKALVHAPGGKEALIARFDISIVRID